MIPSFFWQPAQWQKLPWQKLPSRLWRISRYLWRRRYKSYWLRLRSRWFGQEKFGSAVKQDGKVDLWQSWANRHRRLVLSLLLFGLAIGGAIWLDIARLRFNPDAKPLNEIAVAPSPPPSPVATPPLTSIVQFENFVKPEVSPEVNSGEKSDRPASSSPAASSSTTASTPAVSPRPITQNPETSSPVTSSPVTSSPVTSSPTVSPVSPKPVSASPASRPVQTTPQPNSSADRPPYEIRLAHSSNYGDRFAKDIEGKPLTQAPIIVLHETVYSADSAINYFLTPHSNEDDQASYHTLIRLDGTVIYIVPPEKRAYGAGNSVFDGPNGPETAKTHAQYPPSVNNFAYHISLETPIDGENDLPTHSGYTQAQYRSLAWLVAQSNVPADRITTHKAIDRSNSRIDPRSFDFEYFLQLLRQQRGN